MKSELGQNKMCNSGEDQRVQTFITSHYSRGGVQKKEEKQM